MIASKNTLCYYVNKHKNGEKGMKKRIIRTVVMVCMLSVITFFSCYPDTVDMVEIEWYSDISYWKGISWNSEKNSVTKEITDQTGIICNMDIPKQNAVQELKVRILENDLPDVISIIDESLKKQLIDSGKVWNLEEFLLTYDPDSHILTDFPMDLKQEIMEEEGGWYSYPSHIRSVDLLSKYPECDPYYFTANYYNNNDAIIFNKKWMQKLGITEKDVQTEEQVYEVLMKAEQWKETEDAEFIPLLVDGQRYNDSTLDFFSYSFGALPLSKDGNYQNIMFSDAWKHAVSYMNQLYRSGIIDADQFVYENEEVQKKIQEEKVFCFVGAVTNCGYDAREWYSSGPVLSEYGEIPAVPIQTQTSKWLSTYIAKDCSEPEKIAKWLSYMTSEEGMRTHLLGIEGKDYVENTDGTVIVTQQGLADIADYQESGVRAFWPFYNATWLDSIVVPPQEDAEYYADMKIRTALAQYKNTRIYEDSLFRTIEAEEKITDIYGSVLSSINAYESEQILKMIIAKTPEQFQEIYEETLQQLEYMGAEQLDHALNAVYQQRCALYGITAETNLKETKLYQRSDVKVD